MIRMGYLYILTNTKNKKRLVGKSNLPKWVLKMLLYDALDREKHYNVLLQREWIVNPFEIDFIDCEQAEYEANKYIKDNELLNPMKGYNIYPDLTNKKGHYKKSHIFSDDLCLLYIFISDFQLWARTLDMERNTVANRLAGYGLVETNYYKQKIATYDCYQWSVLRFLYEEGKCYTSRQLIDRVENSCNVSGMLKISPRKITRFLAFRGINASDKKRNGCALFCPPRDEYYAPRGEEERYYKVLYRL